MRHSIAVWMALFALSLLLACGGSEDLAVPETADASLCLNVATLSPSRTSATGDLPLNEKMGSVRVVVLHQNGTVEYNRRYSLLDTERENKFIMLKVTPNEKKKIFLFANEESVASVEGVAGVTAANPKTLTAFFEGYPKNARDFEDAVNGLYFAPDYSNGQFIPMSSMYEVSMGEGYVEKTCYVVRVATKFTVTFDSWRGETVKINSISIANHADRNYLMAHVNSYPNPAEYPTWIDWLKEVSDASNVAGYVTSEVDWLKNYELPSVAKGLTYTCNEPVTVGTPKVDLDHPENSKPGSANKYPVFYLPESRNLKAGAADGEQEYTMTIRIDGREAPFETVLPNLKSLFRNTHVVVNITMYQDLGIHVDVIPYSEVVLEPVFGL